MTFTATVAGNNPTGSVSFTEDGNPDLCGGHAQRQPTHRLVQHHAASRVGMHSIVANYAGTPATRRRAVRRSRRYITANGLL